MWEHCARRSRACSRSAASRSGSARARAPRRRAFRGSGCVPRSRRCWSAGGRDDGAGRIPAAFVPEREAVVNGRGRVCFFAPYLWPAFSQGQIEFAGGAETQQAALARGLVARGFEVAVATCDYGQGRRVEREGITFHATHPPFAGIPVVRFFHPRLSGNLRALLAAKAAVLYQRGAGLQAGIAFDVERSTRAAFVFGSAHDTNAQAEMPLLHNPRDRWWVARAVRGADAIIAQTRVQQDLFRRSWGRESFVIPNLVELPRSTANAGAGGAVVWLSTYKEYKRPLWVVELARRMPSVRFIMAGIIPPTPLTPEVYERTREAARSLPNLEVRGHLAQHRLADFFSSGALLLHTSPLEGF